MQLLANLIFFGLEPERDQGCLSHDQCQDMEACRGGNCVNPCLDSSPCARTAQCLAQQHRAICSCPQGTQGDPFTNCYQPRKSSLKI